MLSTPATTEPIPPEIESVLFSRLVGGAERHSTETIEGKHKLLDFFKRNTSLLHPFDLALFLYKTLQTQPQVSGETLSKIGNHSTLK